MSWPTDPRPAKCLPVLEAQVNAKWPNRDKSSDGMLASSEHSQANPNSDHEPWVVIGGVGVVTAIDITNDPAHGLNSRALAQALLDSHDQRIKYVISNREIASGTGQSNPAWVWRSYTGSNPHTEHMHLSCKSDQAYCDDVTPWNLTGVAVTPPDPTSPMPPKLPTLKKGDKGPDVVKLQQLLVDGDFGTGTELTVKNFQTASGLVADGVVGAYTWQALLQTPPVTPPVAPVPPSARQMGITATVFGGSEDPNNSAYTGRPLGDHDFYVALPDRFEGERPMVRVFKEGKFSFASIEDVGPWNTDDPYWTTGTRPQAESGTDMSGRTTNKAGIDLSPALAKALELDGKGLVDWEFVTTTPIEVTIATPSPVQKDWKDFDIWGWVKSFFKRS